MNEAVWAEKQAAFIKADEDRLAARNTCPRCHHKALEPNDFSFLVIMDGGTGKCAHCGLDYQIYTFGPTHYYATFGGMSVQFDAEGKILSSTKVKVPNFTDRGLIGRFKRWVYSLFGIYIVTFKTRVLRVNYTKELVEDLKQLTEKYSDHSNMNRIIKEIPS